MNEKQLKIILITMSVAMVGALVVLMVVINREKDRQKVIDNILKKNLTAEQLKDLDRIRAESGNALAATPEEQAKDLDKIRTNPKMEKRIPKTSVSEQESKLDALMKKKSN